MDFGFSAEQEAIRETALRFAREELAPRYQTREREGMLERDVVRQMGTLGLIGPEFPPEHGGLGADYVTSGLVMEAVSEGDLNAAYVQLLGSLIGQIIAHHARPEPAAEWLPRICRGEVLLSIALTEPQGGSDAAALRLKAVRDGKHYVLNGEKTSVSMADQADLIVVFARTGSTESKAHGVTAFMLPADTTGLTATRFSDLGERAIGRGSLFFDDVRVPAEYRLGEEGTGFVQVMQGFDFSRALIGLQCIAIARTSLDETWTHIGERSAFGQKLAAFQGVTFPLAEFETYVEAARLMCYRTLWLKDRGLPHTTEAAMCKWWAPKLAFDVVHKCLLLHGHSGYSTELPYEQRLRDVLGLQIGDGTAEIMKMIIARAKAGRVSD